MYISNNTYELSRDSNEHKLLELRNFHDLTIEIVDLEPEIILYIPMLVESNNRDDFNEINDIIHGELIEHIIETAQIVNSKICYFDLNDKTNVFTRQSVKLINAYPRSLIIATKRSEIEFNVILGKILQ